ncbi:MAG: hypothetical protein ACRBBW_16250 [Cellvibrionaceae bacterium]
MDNIKFTPYGRTDGQELKRELTRVTSQRTELEEGLNILTEQHSRAQLVHDRYHTVLSKLSGTDWPSEEQELLTRGLRMVVDRTRSPALLQRGLESTSRNYENSIARENELRLKAYNMDDEAQLDIASLKEMLKSFEHVDAETLRFEGSTDNPRLSVVFRNLTMRPSRNPYDFINAGAQDIDIPLDDIEVVIELTTGIVKFYTTGDIDECPVGYEDRNLPHPHVIDGSGGGACLGDFAFNITDAIQNVEIPTLIVILQSFLQQAADDDCAGKYWVRFISDELHPYEHTAPFIESVDHPWGSVVTRAEYTVDNSGVTYGTKDTYTIYGDEISEDDYWARKAAYEEAEESAREAERIAAEEETSDTEAQATPVENPAPPSEAAA